MPQHKFMVEGVKMSVTRKFGIYYATVEKIPNKLIIDITLKGAVKKALFSAMAAQLISREIHNSWTMRAEKERDVVMKIESFQVGTTHISLEKGEIEGTISATIRSPQHQEVIRILNAGNSLGEAKVHAISMAQSCGLVSQDDVDQALGL